MKSVQIIEASKIRGPYWGVPILRTIIYWGAPLCSNSHVQNLKELQLANSAN